MYAYDRFVIMHGPARSAAAEILALALGVCVCGKVWTSSAEEYVRPTQTARDGALVFGVLSLDVLQYQLTEFKSVLEKHTQDDR
jgi:hypothetical protein